MSCYEWTSGEVVIPTGQYAGVKKMIRDAHTAYLQRGYEEAQKFWSGLTRRQQTDVEAYREALQLWLYGDYSSNRDGGASDDLVSLLGWVLSPRGSAETGPRRLLKTDLTWPNSRTTHMGDGDLDISFVDERHAVRYDVGENNHARDHAQRSHLHKAFYDAMDKVRWTRTSGGVLLGNDEYNREGGYEMEGGGGSYVVDAFGPLGVKEAPNNVRTPFLDSDGRKQDVETTLTRTGLKGKIVPFSSRAPFAYGRYGR